MWRTLPQVTHIVTPYPAMLRRLVRGQLGQGVDAAGRDTDVGRARVPSVPGPPHVRVLRQAGGLRDGSPGENPSKVLPVLDIGVDVGVRAGALGGLLCRCCDGVER